jgi:hypothetical protein
MQLKNKNETFHGNTWQDGAWIDERLKEGERARYIERHEPSRTCRSAWKLRFNSGQLQYLTKNSSHKHNGRLSRRHRR